MPHGNFGQITDLRVNSLMCNGRTVLKEDCSINVPAANVRNLTVKNTANFANVEVGGTLNVTEPINIEGNLFINGVQVVGPRQINVPDITLDGTLTGLVGSNNGELVDTSIFGPVNQNFVELAAKINEITNVLRQHGLM